MAGAIGKQAVICDLDDTLTNAAHKDHLAKAKQWKAFEAASENDPVNQWCLDLITTLSKSGKYEIIYVTGRQEGMRSLSQNWLKRHNAPDGVLLMRSAKDYRSDNVVKKQIYEKKIAPYYDVAFCLEDRPHIADMWRSLGLVCLLCSDKEKNPQH